MRDLQECQAEVFRRSEKKIQERKKRGKRLLTGCVALVVCTAALGAFLLPGTAERTGNSGLPNAAGGAFPELRGESYVCSIAGITVTGHGFSRTVTKPEEILRIWDQLQALCAQTPGDEPSTDGSDSIKHNENNSSPIYSSVSGDADYRITLTMWEGEPAGYLLTDSALKDLTAGKTYPLTPSQVDQWKTLLGIAD